MLRVRELDGLAKHAFERGNGSLVPLVKRPLLDPLRIHQTRRHKHAHVLTDRGLTDAEFLRDQHTTNAVILEIAVDLGTKVPRRLLEPIENLQAAIVVDRAKWLEQSGKPVGLVGKLSTYSQVTSLVLTP